jgi:hypothetical protein
MANSAGLIMEHRLVAARTIGRPLRRDEVVHHKNRNRGDNRPENLDVRSRSDHGEEHLADLAAGRELGRLRAILTKNGIGF